MQENNSSLPTSIGNPFDNSQTATSASTQPGAGAQSVPGNDFSQTQYANVMPQNKTSYEKEVRDHDDDDDHDGSVAFPNPFKLLWIFIKKIRALLKLGCLLIFVAIAVAIITVIFKPPVLWNPVKGFLNENKTHDTDTPITVEQVYQRINEQALSSGGRFSMQLTPNEIAALLSKKINVDKATFVEINEGKLAVFINIDNPEQPLWGVIELAVSEENEVSLAKMGLVRFALPQSLTSVLGSKAQDVLSFLNRDDLTSLIDELIDEAQLETSLEVVNAKLDANGISIDLEKR